MLYRPPSVNCHTVDTDSCTGFFSSEIIHGFSPFNKCHTAVISNQLSAPELPLILPV